MQPDETGIEGIVDAFEAAAHRAIEAGFKVLEIHAAHGWHAPAMRRTIIVGASGLIVAATLL